MNTSQALTSKVAVITGSTRNMGRAFAEALARSGADIVVHYHSAASQSDAEETVRLVKAQGTRALAVGGDLADPAVVKRLFDETFNAFGRVDIVINNAGQVIKKPFVEITEADFDRSFGINAKAAFFVMQEAARRISDQGRISIWAPPFLARRSHSTLSTRARKQPLKTYDLRAAAPLFTNIKGYPSGFRVLGARAWCACWCQQTGRLRAFAYRPRIGFGCAREWVG